MVLSFVPFISGNLHIPRTTSVTSASSIMFSQFRLQNAPVNDSRQSAADSGGGNLSARDGAAHELLYGVNDVPPWYTCLLLGFQVVWDLQMSMSYQVRSCAIIETLVRQGRFSLFIGVGTVYRRHDDHLVDNNIFYPPARSQEKKLLPDQHSLHNIPRTAGVWATFARPGGAHMCPPPPS